MATIENEIVKVLYEDKNEPVLEMAKLSAKYANKSIIGPIDNFIYFSPVLDSHAPRIKFYGGTKETGTTQKASSL